METTCGEDSLLAKVGGVVIYWPDGTNRTGILSDRSERVPNIWVFVSIMIDTTLSAFLYSNPFFISSKVAAIYRTINVHIMPFYFIAGGAHWPIK